MDYEICCNYLDNGLDIPIGSLVNYMLEEFPDSCFAYNWGENNNMAWDDSLIIVNAYKVFRYEVLGWCGCGTPEKADEAVEVFLEAFGVRKKDKAFGVNLLDYDKRHSILEKYFGTSNVYDNILFLCFAYTMDAAGLTEHGTSIGGAWTSDRGRIYLWILNKMKEIGRCDLEG